MSKKVLPGFPKILFCQGVLVFFCMSFWIRQDEKQTIFAILKVALAPL